tara:strand:+ start:1132 stop:2940 length:1809 start_codon:yes stop_codon:yes gene_type:complete
MADVKITELTALASANVVTSSDVVPIVDASVPQTKKITVDNLVAPITLDKSNSRVGIGETSPASLLHVKTTANASETIRIQNDDSLTTVGVSSDGYSFHTYQHSLYWASWDGSTWSTKARLDNNGNLGIGITSVGAKLHVAHSSGTAYNGSAEILESVIIQNTNGTDNTGVNNVASLGFQVADGATSQGFLNYIRTGNNTGEFTFSQRTGSSSYAEHLKIENDGTVVIPGAIQSTGNVSITSTVKYFQVMSHTDTSKVTKHAYDGLYTSGSQNQFIQSGQAIKFYPNATLNMQMSAGGSFQVGAGAIGTTNADNWKIVSKTTTGGTIDSTDGAGYFALGDNYTTSGGILMVRNDGNRGSRRHASGSSLFKAAFNDVTAFEIKKSGEIHGGYGCPVAFTGNWEVIDVISTGSSTGSLSSNNCFNDQTYSHFKIIIPYYRPTDNATDILFSFLYNTGGGLNEHVGDYYGHKQSMAHTNSGYLGGTYTNANRMTIFSGASNSTHAPTHGEITVFNVNTGDTRNFDTGKFTAHDYTGDGDTGSTYRPIGYFDMVGYNDTSDYYSRDTGMFRCNTSRHASYWKGFRIQQNTGNIAANTKIIILGMKL